MADYERLQFGLAVTRDHASKADNSVAYRGDPKVLGADPMQVFIELQAGVVPTDTWALVDLAVPVGEFDPERAARRKIVRRVVPDRDWIGGR
jgi:hypothetical protein